MIGKFWCHFCFLQAGNAPIRCFSTNIHDKAAPDSQEISYKSLGIDPLPLLVTRRPIYTSSSSNTALGNNLSLNQTILAGISFTFIPALSKFRRSEIAKIKCSQSARRT